MVRHTRTAARIINATPSDFQCKPEIAGTMMISNGISAIIIHSVCSKWAVTVSQLIKLTHYSLYFLVSAASAPLELFSISSRISRQTPFLAVS